jgi:hypothetical protein
MLHKIEAYIDTNQGICTQREIQVHCSLSKTSVTKAIKMLRMSHKRSSVQMGQCTSHPKGVLCLPLLMFDDAKRHQNIKGSADYPYCPERLRRSGNRIGKHS